MGLEEKRVLQDIQHYVLPEVQSELQKIVGAELELKVVWENFPEEMPALQNVRDNLYDILLTFRSICTKDDFECGLLRDSVRSIVLKNDPSDDHAICFKDGVIELQGRFHEHPCPTNPCQTNPCPTNAGVKTAPKKVREPDIHLL